MRSPWSMPTRCLLPSRIPIPTFRFEWSFPNSNHSLLSEGPMDLRIRHYSEMIDWFRKYL